MTRSMKRARSALAGPTRTDAVHRFGVGVGVDSNICFLRTELVGVNFSDLLARRSVELVVSRS